LISFGTAIGDIDAYRRYAEPGIRRVAEPDSQIFAFAAVGSICRQYNLLLDAAAREDRLEALVIVHSHVEIVDPDFCAKVREALSDPEVGVVGCVGATGVRSIAWWEGSVSSAPVIHRYHEHGGGELPAYAWVRPHGPGAQADAVDGFLLVISPWVVRNVRFDESLRLGHGYDVDYCLQVRAAGRKVRTADLRVVYNRALEMVTHLDLWTEAHIQVAEKWGGLIGCDGGRAPDWKQRARRAEAERDAAHAIAYSKELEVDARVMELERMLAAATDTVSWRITTPLRRLNQLRRDLRPLSRAGKDPRGG
jgi:hypothetical protein